MPTYIQSTDVHCTWYQVPRTCLIHTLVYPKYIEMLSPYYRYQVLVYVSSMDEHSILIVLKNSTSTEFKCAARFVNMVFITIDYLLVPGTRYDLVPAKGE